MVNREWMQRHPVATKRALRALYRGMDTVAADPDGSARSLVDRGFTTNFTYASQNLREVPHDVWRTYDPADSLRFYALRLKEAGLMEGTPEQVIAQATDFRYLEELKRELRRG